MSIKLLEVIFGLPVNSIVSDLSYDIEKRLVSQSKATYDLTDDVKNNPTKLQAASVDNSASVEINGWAVNVQPRKPMVEV